MIDLLPPVVFDLFIEAYGLLAGRPLQRRRARRLAKRGKIRSVLFGANPAGVLPSQSLDGAAEVWEGRIRLWDADLWVQDVDLPPEAGPLKDLDDRGNVRPSDGNLAFRPKTAIFTLRTHRGHVRWTVLAWQADEALAMLGFGQPESEPHPFVETSRKCRWLRLH